MPLLDYRELSPQQRDQLIDLHVHPAQLRYSGDVASAVYTLLSSPSDDRRGIVLPLDGVPRAFLLLQRRAFLPQWSENDAATIAALQVDRRFQGRGLGRSLMQALPDQVRAMWPEVRRLQLSVDRGNHAALALYLGTGWSHSGDGYRATTGYEYRLTLNL